MALRHRAWAALECRVGVGRPWTTTLMVCRREWCCRDLTLDPAADQGTSWQKLLKAVQDQLQVIVGGHGPSRAQTAVALPVRIRASGPPGPLMGSDTVLSVRLRKVAG